MSGPRILAIAYACMPAVGSEPGTGFAWARILGGIGETWILTRPWPARRAELEAALAAAPEAATVHLEYVDLPRRLGTADWDPFTHGHQRLEYLLWQLAALRTARRLARRHKVDLVWHLTFANVWMGSVGALVGPRFILGPVGGGVGPPWRLLAGSGPRAVVGEIVRSAVRTAARYLNPLARLAWSRAVLILAQNRETLAWLPASARPRTVLFHHVALEERPAARQPRPSDGAPPVAMFAGRLIPWKGVALAVRAVAALPGWGLIVAGSGSQEGALRELAGRLGIADRVEFRGWVPRQAVLDAMRDEADVLLFPSLHEEGGWAVGEALAMGLPVVCLDRGGPPLVGGRPVATGPQGATVDRLAAAARAAVEDPPTAAPIPFLEDRRAALLETLQARGLV